jgi:hypothetical protein
VTTTTQPALSGGYLNKRSFGAIFLRVTKTGPRRFEGVAVYRFLLDDGPASGQAALTGVTDGREVVMQLTPVDTGPGGWLFGRHWSGYLDPRTRGFTVDWPSPITGGLKAIDFRPATSEDYNEALRKARP